MLYNIDSILIITMSISFMIMVLKAKFNDSHSILKVILKNK